MNWQKPRIAVASLFRPLGQVEDHCCKLAGGKVLPNRRDFHPYDLHWIYGYFYTVDLVDRGEDYRFAYLGDFWKNLFFEDFSGQLLSECEERGRFRMLREIYDNVVAIRHPIYSTGKAVWPDNESVIYERLTIPFGDEDGRPSMLLVAAQCERGIGELMHCLGRRGPGPAADVACSGQL